MILLSEFKSERQIPYDITYMWNLKYDIFGYPMGTAGKISVWFKQRDNIFLFAFENGYSGFLCGELNWKGSNNSKLLTALKDKERIA